jgi:1,4-alpha-glucan branching enzyme
MGNEFGHPEWIDFPREGNQWSYKYARRQWRLVDNPHLKYQQLARFDRDMIETGKKYRLLASGETHLIKEHTDDKIIAFERGGLLFFFNFHPTRSLPDYTFDVYPGKYRVILNSDSEQYGGFGRIEDNEQHLTRSERQPFSRGNYLSLYLPARTALVLKQVDEHITGEKTEKGVKTT